MKRLACVKIQFPGQILEDEALAGLPSFETVFVGWSNVLSSKYKQRQFVPLKLSKSASCALISAFTRQPLSAPSPYELEGLPEVLSDVDVIFTAEPYSFVTQQCAKIASRENIPLVVSCFETLPSSPQMTIPPYVHNLRIARKAAAAFIAYTKKAAYCLRSLGVDTERIHQVYLGIETEIFKPMDGFEAKRREETRILFVGRLDREKGIRYLLKAFARLHNKSRDDSVVLWIVASRRSGSNLRVIKDAMKRYPIRLSLDVPRLELPAIYRSCDIFCAPSIVRKMAGIPIWEEQFGVVLLEAMSCGLPIVSTDCGAVPEILGNGNLVVRQRDSKQLAQALAMLLDDDRLRRNVGMANRRKVVTGFSLERQTQLLNGILLDIDRSAQR